MTKNIKRCLTQRISLEIFEQTSLRAVSSMLSFLRLRDFLAFFATAPLPQRLLLYTATHFYCRRLKKNWHTPLHTLAKALKIIVKNNIKNNSSKPSVYNTLYILPQISIYNTRKNEEMEIWFEIYSLLTSLFSSTKLYAQDKQKQARELKNIVLK